MRFLRRLGLSRNPLARHWDRLEAVLILLLLVAAALALPIAAATGSVTFADQMAMATAQSRSRHQVVATFGSAQPTPSTPSPSPIDEESSTTFGAASRSATWVLPDGSVRTGTIVGASDVGSAQAMRIWVDDSGQQVGAPLTSTDATFTAAIATAFVELTAIAFLAVLYWVGRAVLDRLRTRQWSRDLARLTEHGTLH